MWKPAVFENAAWRLAAKRPRGAARAGLLLLAGLLLTGCGDVFRPVANPVNKPGGDPQLVHYAIVVSQAPSGQQGTTTQVNVSGDTNNGNIVVGRTPVYAAVLSGEVWVPNSADDNVSFYSAAASGSTQPSLVSLPAGSRPVFVGSSELQTVYVVNSGTNSVGVISVFQGALTSTIGVGSNPVALVETPDSSKLYVVNKGSGTVSVISTATASVLGSPIPVGASPVWAVMRPDGAAVYVVNQGSGTVSVIDTASNTVTATLSVGASPNYAIFDGNLLRLYVTNPGSNSVSVFDANPAIPVPLNQVAVGAAPVSVTALADGSRFYIANSGCSDIINLQGCTGNTVSVVDARSFQVRKTVTVGTAPVSLASDPGSTKVIVASRGSASSPGNITDIQTVDDTVVLSIVPVVTPGVTLTPMWVTISQ